MPYRVYTQDELRGMDRGTFTRAVIAAAAEIVGAEISADRSLPFDAGAANNEFAEALLAPVPEGELYGDDVFWTNVDGRVEFAPWLYRLAFKPAVSIYANYYNRVNQHSGRRFPTEQFMTSVRTIKLRGYQRDRRARARARAEAPECSEHPSPRPQGR